MPGASRQAKLESESQRSVMHSVLAILAPNVPRWLQQPTPLHLVHPPRPSGRGDIRHR